MRYLAFLVVLVVLASGYQHISFHRTSFLRLLGLKSGTDERISYIRQEYERVVNDLTIPFLEIAHRTELEKQKKSYDVILNCIEALKTIESDLELFEEHLKGPDEKLKSTAETFSKEFIQCRTQIENQLNKILWEKDSNE
jgi:predicted DNA-binding protein YlxM (UPF0122 family)